MSEPSSLNAASPRACSFIKGFETCRLHAFLPTPNDVPTIGWGATGPDIKLGLVWTQKQADDRFAADMARFGGGLLKVLGHAPTTQAQFDALVSLDYNIGAEAFRNSTLLRYHLSGRYADAAAQFAVWNKQAGHVLDGLTRRRAAEAAIYRGS